MPKYIDTDGIEYESYEAYCNAPDLDPDEVGVLLSLGRRTPQNDYEKRLLKEIKELKEKNIPIEFPQ
ncbi:MAG: hypothetical protein BWY08_01276 [Bacteroidetes bacterium ADurb.Bin174]|jgi:hypothetical protein|nr:MAG: hypothetical protein BWY08_01276 [Bacteroidetes bacterium ADurb.Bin174]